MVDPVSRCTDSSNLKEERKKEKMKKKDEEKKQNKLWGLQH